MVPESTIYNLARRQGGVVTRRQAVEIGMSGTRVDSKVRYGQWTLVGSGAYRLLPPVSTNDTLRAAVAVLPKATVSHYSAAVAHGFARIPRSVPTVTVHSSTTHRFDGVKVFRTRDLTSRHVKTIAGLPTTTPARTVVDLASQLTERHFASVVDDCVAAGRVQWVDIAAVVDDVARRGKPGIAMARDLLESRVGDDFTGSRLEAAGVVLLRSAGITGFTTEYPFPWEPTRRFDIAFPSHRLAVEWDSRRWHSQASAIQTDRDRDRIALLHGWRVVRFTWDDVHERGDTVVSTVRQLIGSD